MGLTKTQAVLIAAVGFFVLLIVLIILGVLPGLRGGTRSEQISGELTFWGVFDSTAVINELISAYQRERPKVQINYRQLDPKSYENELINALAAGRGPDILMFHNTWLPKHFNKLEPLPENLLPFSKFQSLFPTVVEQDFAPDGVIYALPLYVDTLAMFYNQDIFDSKGISIPPKTWADFEDVVPKLREMDRRGRITKPAAAIGGSQKSINRATDILNLLMLQAGTQMVDKNFTRAEFASPSGQDALEFYTQFSDPNSPLFTWSDEHPYSVDSFAAGHTAIMFNYSHQIAAIEEKNPFLNFRIAPMPQPAESGTKVNYANYWGLGVSAQSRNKIAAWDFITWLTANASNAKKYADITNRPPALRSLINQYLDHPRLGPFARQALSARSWPQIDNNKVEEIFNEMIEKVITNRQSALRALQEAENKVTALMQ